MVEVKRSRITFVHLPIDRSKKMSPAQNSQTDNEPQATIQPEDEILLALMTGVQPPLDIARFPEGGYTYANAPAHPQLQIFAMMSKNCRFCLNAGECQARAGIQHRAEVDTLRAQAS